MNLHRRASFSTVSKSSLRRSSVVSSSACSCIPFFNISISAYEIDELKKYQYNTNSSYHKVYVMNSNNNNNIFSLACNCVDRSRLSFVSFLLTPLLLRMALCKSSTLFHSNHINNRIRSGLWQMISHVECNEDSWYTIVTRTKKKNIKHP